MSKYRIIEKTYCGTIYYIVQKKGWFFGSTFVIRGMVEFVIHCLGLKRV